TSPGLVDRAIEIFAELARVDAYRSLRGTQHFLFRHEHAPAGSERPKLGHRLADAGHDEGLPGSHGGDHLGVVVAKLALGDGPAHPPTVAMSATYGYSVRLIRENDGTTPAGWSPG